MFVFLLFHRQKNRRRRNRKKKKKKRDQENQPQKENEEDDKKGGKDKEKEKEKDKDKEPEVEIEYITEEPEIYDPNFIFFKRIFEAFKVRRGVGWRVWQCCPAHHHITLHVIFS